MQTPPLPPGAPSSPALPWRLRTKTKIADCPARLYNVHDYAIDDYDDDYVDNDDDGDDGDDEPGATSSPALPWRLRTKIAACPARL